MGGHLKHNVAAWTNFPPNWFGEKLFTLFIENNSSIEFVNPMVWCLSYDHIKFVSIYPWLVFFILWRFRGSIIIYSYGSDFLEVITSLKVIVGKSEIVPVGEVGNLATLACILFCKVGCLPMSYLDMPLGAHYKDSSIWNPIIERV